MYSPLLGYPHRIINGAAENQLDNENIAFFDDLAALADQEPKMPEGTQMGL